MSFLVLVSIFKILIFLAAERISFSAAEPTIVSEIFSSFLIISIKEKTPFSFLTFQHKLVLV